MVTASIGAWSFSLPEGWEVQLSDEHKTYVEAPNKARGIYIQSVAPTPTDTEATEFAAHLQDVHRESYSELDDSDWNVVARRDAEQHGFCTSVMDIMDLKSQYCIRFIVVCGPDKGLRLALHDYLCKEYGETKAFFDSIEATIVRGASAA